VADIVSSGLLSEREIEPVVSLLVLPQPATPAAIAAMNAMVIRRLLVKANALVGIVTPSPFLRGHWLAVFPPAEIFC
jgi:hypothetical protein